MEAGSPACSAAPTSSSTPGATRRGASDGAWCNPPGRGLGTRPTTATGSVTVDAFLWIKLPGESDGPCNGGPAAGTFWPDGALALARASAW